MKKTIVVTCIILVMAWCKPSYDEVASAQNFEPGQIATDHTGAEMVYVPSGEFEYGVSEQLLQLHCEVSGENHWCLGIQGTVENYQPRLLEVDAFWIDRYEVTVEQYQNCNFNVQGVECPTSIFIGDSNKLESEYPIIGVSWYDAEKYCNYRNARLPTGVEWEYAASGPDNLTFPWGHQLHPDIISFRETYPVGSLAANVSWIGAYDMAGNAWEWTSDNVIEAQYNRRVVESVGDSWKVAMGSSYGSSPLLQTTFSRQAYLPYINDVIGIRCVRTTEP